jgi:hypothetical protein
VAVVAQAEAVEFAHLRRLVLSGDRRVTRGIYGCRQITATPISSRQ